MSKKKPAPTPPVPQTPTLTPADMAAQLSGILAELFPLAPRLFAAASTIPDAAQEPRLFLRRGAAAIVNAIGFVEIAAASLRRIAEDQAKAQDEQDHAR